MPMNLQQLLYISYKDFTLLLLAAPHILAAVTMKTKTKNSCPCPLLILINVWLFCCFHTPFVSAQCLEDQKSLLHDLKNSLTFSKYAVDKLESWNQTTDCCMWSGVECDNSNGRVIGLDLSGKCINGSIDNSCSLFRLRFLQRLNLAGNDEMVGKIPSAIGNLSSLTYLNLSDTGFTGQVPVEISQLVKLTVLDISHRNYVDMFMMKPNLATIIQNMSNMRGLYLGEINNSAMGNKWCQALSSSLPRLQVLSMVSCDLRGEIHKSLSKLQSLSEINLDYNYDIGGSMPEFLAEFTNLTWLSLSSTHLVGTLPGNFFQIRTLRFLDLSINDLQGSLPSSISNLKKLRRLNLYGCFFNGSIPSSVESLNLLEELNLSSNNFSGSIPSFSSMKNLTILDLSQNSLSGSINSTDWGKLINLEDLDLSINSLDGSIPKSLFSIPSLHYINFYSNKFSGINEFGSIPFSQIRTLILSNNSLEESIFNSIFQLRKLERLDLFSNKLNGTFKLVEFLLNFKNLNHLDLSFNFLSIDLDGCSVNSSFPQLKTLNLASCNLPAIPIFLKNQTNLRILDLSMNSISGIIPEWMWKIRFNLNLSSNYFVQLEPLLNHSFSSSGQILDLHSNFLHGKFPIVTYNFAYLDCSNNNFTSFDPEFSKYISNANFLSFSNNNLVGNIPLLLCNASSIQFVNFEHNQLSGTIPDCLIENTNVRVLNLRRNKKLNGAIPDKFSKNCRLESLYLNDNYLQGRILHSLVNCKELNVLDLGDNLMNDTFPCHLKSLSKLQVLILRYNKFHGNIVCSGNHSDWKLLQVVDLSFNDFSGEIASDILLKWTSMMVGANKLKRKASLHDDDLTVFDNYYANSVTLTFKGQNYVIQNNLAIFVSLDFSNNAFHGELPKEIGNLNALVVLNLSHNSFSGSIPSSIGNLSQIESLDISWNNFSGHIPMELANLNFLSYLNMSFNMLWGKIPTSTQLQTFDASSFKGNRGLFGPPLTPFSRGEPGRTSSTSGSSEGSNWSSKSTLDWLWMGAEVGFPVGITIFIGPLLYIKRWRQWYCRLLYKLVIKILRKEDHARGRRNRRTGRQRQRR